MKSDIGVADRSVENCSAFWIISASVCSFIISSALRMTREFSRFTFSVARAKDRVEVSHNYACLRRRGREKGTHDHPQAAVYAV